MIPLPDALAALPPHWSRLDLRAAPPEHGRALIDGAAAVVVAPHLVHAIGEAPFDATAALLLAARPHLPDRFELRVGPAAAGIVARTHIIDMVGPMWRMRAPARAPLDPTGLVALGPADAARVIALRDPDHELDPCWLAHPGWLGLIVQGGLVAAAGPRAHGDVVSLAPPRLSRGARKTDAGTRVLAALALRFPGALLDLRMDRRDRVALAIAAGYERLGPWERWTAVRRARLPRPRALLSHGPSTETPS